MSSSRIKSRILVIVAMLALLFSGLVSYTNSYTFAEAGMFCSEIGSDVHPRKVGGMYQGASNPEAPNREWTAEELFRNSVGFSTYYGEGDKTWWFANTSDRGSGADGYEDVKDKIEAARGCVNFNFIPNMIIGATNIITGVTSTITLILVGEDIMAETLSKIIGGDGNNDEGLIGTFLSSFYMPLIVITVMIMTITIIYKGLIQFKMREALNSLLWTLGAFILGVALMLNPQLLTSIPQKATSTITTCVLGALSGQNCMTGEVETPSILAGKECLSSVTGGSEAESVVNSMNCTIWKTFTLEPWAEAQFGAPYNELYTKNAPAEGGIWTNLPEDKEDKYCVNFTSADSYEDSMKKGSPTMNGATNEEVCNVALYHLFLRTKMIDETSQDGNNYEDGFVTDDTGRYDKRWYDIIIPMAGDDSRWDSWSGSQFFNRIGTSLMGLIAVTAASTVLLTLAVFGGAYKVVGLILMAFAPVFFLFAIEPTRGRRIFLGWLETLVSSILKYFAITVMIIVSLVMYAGLLSNTSGPMTLVGVIVLTFALHMYRKEITDLIGMSNMGGQRLSNRAKDVGSWAARHAKEKTSASVGGALGGGKGQLSSRKANIRARKETVEDLQRKLVNATTDDERKFYSNEIYKENMAIEDEGSFIGTAIKGSASGSVDSVKRSMKRGTGVIANVYQQSGRTKSDLDTQAKKQRDKEGKAREAHKEENFVVRDNKDNASEQRDNQVVEENKKTSVNPAQSEHKKGKEVVDAEWVEVEEKSWDVEFEEARDNMGDVKYGEDLSKEEIEELDKLAREIKSSHNDEELLKLVKQDEVLNDPNKKKLVSHELNARINAYNEAGVSIGELSEATALDKAGSIEEFKATLETVKTDYKMNPIPAGLDEYSSGLADLGFSQEEIEEERMKLLEETVDSRDYSKALEVTLDNGFTSLEDIQKDTGSTESEARAIMELMEHKGVVEGDPENESTRILIKEDEKADNSTVYREPDKSVESRESKVLHEDRDNSKQSQGRQKQFEIPKYDELETSPLSGSNDENVKAEPTSNEQSSEVRADLTSHENSNETIDNKIPVEEGEHKSMNEDNFTQHSDSRFGRHEPEVDTRFDSVNYDEKKVQEEVKDELADELEAMRAEMQEYTDSLDEEDDR